MRNVKICRRALHCSDYCRTLFYDVKDECKEEENKGFKERWKECRWWCKHCFFFHEKTTFNTHWARAASSFLSTTVRHCYKAMEAILGIYLPDDFYRPWKNSKKRKHAPDRDKILFFCAFVLVAALIHLKVQESF